MTAKSDNDAPAMTKASPTSLRRRIGELAAELETTRRKQALEIEALEHANRALRTDNAALRASNRALASANEALRCGNEALSRGATEDGSAPRQELHELRERNRQLDLAQAISGIGYWRLDLDSEAIYWSEQIFHIHGVPLDDGVPALEDAIAFYHPDDRARVIANVDTATREEHSFEFEARLVRLDGSERYVHCAGQSHVDASGRPYAVFGVFRDITDVRAREADLKRTLEQLSRSNEELYRFSYVCSHDMKEPVRMIESMSELLLDPDIGRDEERRGELVARIGRNMKRLKATIDNLLAYSRLDAEIESADIDLNAVVAEVVDSLNPEIVRRGATIEVGRLSVVHGARTHFQQLFQNLVGNALKYSDKPEPLIRVTASRHAETRRFVVEDNGPGIPEASLNDVFGVFSRLRLQRDIEGTGLGLAICRRIVEQYGGRIVARRSELGGAAFDFHLPATGATREP